MKSVRGAELGLRGGGGGLAGEGVRRSFENRAVGPLGSQRSISGLFLVGLHHLLEGPVDQGPGQQAEQDIERHQPPPALPVLPVVGLPVRSVLFAHVRSPVVGVVGRSSGRGFVVRCPLLEEGMAPPLVDVMVKAVLDMARR